MTTVLQSFKEGKELASHYLQRLRASSTHILCPSHIHIRTTIISASLLTSSNTWTRLKANFWGYYDCCSHFAEKETDSLISSHPGALLDLKARAFHCTVQLLTSLCSLFIVRLLTHGGKRESQSRLAPDSSQASEFASFQRHREITLWLPIALDCWFSGLSSQELNPSKEA